MIKRNGFWHTKWKFQFHNENLLHEEMHLCNPGSVLVGNPWLSKTEKCSYCLGKIHWIQIKYIYSQVSNTDPSGTHFMDLSLTTKWSGHVMMNSRMSTHRWYFVQSSGSLIRMGLGTDLGHSLRSSVGTKNNVKHIRIFPVIVNSWICLSILLVK